MLVAQRNLHEREEQKVVGHCTPDVNVSFEKSARAACGEGRGCQLWIEPLLVVREVTNGRTYLT